MRGGRTGKARRAASGVRYNEAVPKLSDYTVVVQPDAEEFLAYVPAIPGCHAAGTTPDEARTELENVFAMFAEHAEERGVALPAG